MERYNGEMRGAVTDAAVFLADEAVSESTSIYKVNNVYIQNHIFLHKHNFL